MKQPRKKQKQTKTSALHKAVSLLARKSYGIHEMRCKLKTAGYESEDIETAVDRLVQEGYLDDRAYVRAYVRDQMRLRRKGPKLIRAELLAKKVAAETVDAVLEEQYPQDLQWENVLALIEKWSRSSASYTEQQLMRKLIQKGYGPSMAGRALREQCDGQGFLDTP